MTTYYLQMLIPQQLQSKTKLEYFEIIKAEIPNYRVNRFLL